MIHRLLIILTRDLVGFFYREDMITGYNSLFPVQLNGQNKLLQNESESDAARFIAHKSNLSCSK